MTDLFKGFAYLIQGFRILFQPGFRLFLFVPVTVNIALFVLLIMWAKSMFSGWMGYLMSWLPEWLAFMEWFFWLVYVIAIVMTIFYGFVAAANLLGAPFYGYLSELVEKQLDKQVGEQAFSWKELIAMIPRTVVREFQKIMYYLPRIIGLLLLGFIPGINALVAIAWIIFSAWMMAIQYLDYPADNNGLSFPNMRKYLGHHRSAAFGFGLLTFGFSLIPILNLVALPAAVCGATVFWVERKKGINPADLRLGQGPDAQTKALEQG